LARPPPISYEQAAAVVEVAIERGRISLALAQALQFELSLRQIDVIGEWLPENRGGGGILYRNSRWASGLLWSNIARPGAHQGDEQDGGARRVATTEYPLVMKVLGLVPTDRRIGPMIVSESTGRPYRPNHFQKEWRAIARAAGVPDNVWNRDSRAGGITEGDEAGADPRDPQRHATHSDFKRPRAISVRRLGRRRRRSLSSALPSENCARKSPNEARKTGRKPSCRNAVATLQRGQNSPVAST